MSSTVSLPNQTFTGQAYFSKRLTCSLHILLPETDNRPSWIRGRKRMTPENIPWSNLNESMKYQILFSGKNKNTYFKMSSADNFTQGPVVQSVVSLTSSLRVISLTVLADSIYNFLKFFAEKMWVAFALQKLLTFFLQKFQHICVSLDVNFNKSLTNDVVSFEQLGPEC